jgi:hypothetical protein
VPLVKLKILGAPPLPHSGRKSLISMGLREVGVAKIVIQKDLDRRIFITNNLAAERR